MKVAIASGKGGTGKTTVAVALALCAPGPVRLLDCDVEEPNCHIFLKPEIKRQDPVAIPVPSVDESKCTACGECSKMCQYHAIVCLETEPLVFSELCHGCGGCAKVCPTGAITEVPCEIGTVRTGAHNGIDFIQGQLKVGQPMSPPVIRAVKKHAADDSLNIIDCPPGTACPVVTAVKDSDLVILVTEPTPFGLHDLKLAVDMVRELKIPFGVVVNRVGAGDDRVHAFCREQEIPILLEIPDDRRIAETYSRGELMVEALPKYRPLFAGLLSQLLEVKISGGG